MVRRSSSLSPLKNRAAKINAADKIVTDLQEEILFDHRLKERYMMKENV
jgi:hypothetical protein